MLSEWDIQQYAERTMQKEGFEAGAKWARDIMQKESESDFYNLLDSFAPKNRKIKLKETK